MNKKILSIFLIIAILSMTACTSKEEVEVTDITIEDSNKLKNKDITETEDDKYSNYPYNIENAEDASGYVYPENLIVSRDWGADETDVLAEFAMQQAEDEDIESKELVALVVLNRVWTEGFPDTVQEVINDFQNEQDTVYEYIEPSDECYEAIGIIQYDGWNESQDALYFVADDTGDKSYYDENYEELFSHGKFTFYK